MHDVPIFICKLNVCILGTRRQHTYLASSVIMKQNAQVRLM